MREFSTPAAASSGGRRSLTDDVVAHLRKDPHRVLLRRRNDLADPTQWADVTAADFHLQVTTVAKGLLAAGVRAGETVAVLSRTRYEWTLFDYAIWWVGAVTVPVYESTPAEQVAYLLDDASAVAVIVDSAAHHALVDSVADRLPVMRQLWRIDEGAVQLLSDLGAQVADEALETRRAGVTAAQLATIVYTSGTSGHPKGCALTHGHFIAELDSLVEALVDPLDRDDASTLLFLPLAHVFARVVQVCCIRTGATLGHTADVGELNAALASFRPSFVLAVPQSFERIHAAASQQAAVDGRSRLFAAATTTAVAWSRAHETGRPGRTLRARHAFFERVVYRQLRADLGGRVRYGLCGGAPLSERLGHFFRGIGVSVLEGYGLTEATGALTVNVPGLHKVGTVGRPLPGVTVRVADDGELLFRGAQVFDGYLSDQATTSGVLIDGWLHTGDLGEVDGEGFVRVTGRRNDVLVTAGGKSVAPALLEDRICAHPLVSHAIIVGDGAPYVAALVTLDTEAAAAWARRLGRPTDTAELVDDPDLRDEIQTAVNAANTTVSAAESVRRFVVLTSQWTQAGGQLTPSLKLKRQQILADHHAEVAALYR
ncbi:MAG: AMP-dependent synthetase/ligase [Actinomycetota bacterium]|nr:AMP-dependent synthetase/ligase [Actinomycetota bacterium]